MTDNLQSPTPMSQPVNTPAVIAGFSPQPKKSHKKIWKVVGIAAGSLCLCTTICIAAIVLVVRSTIVERAPVASVLDSYMKYMMAKDVESAYALFSPRAQRQFPISGLQKLVEGKNYIVFEGYQSLSLTSFIISFTPITNSDSAQGLITIVAGTITYKGSLYGTFNGTLEKVNGKWKIYGIFANSPPEKILP